MIKRSSRAIVATTKPIFQAIEKDDWPAVQELVADNKKLLNEPNEEGKSPLHFACALGRTKIVTFLLGAGAHVNFMNKFDKRGSFRRVPLHDAAKGGHASVVQCLAQRDAELNIKDGQGDTALHLAAGFLIQATPGDGWDIETLRQDHEPHYLATVKALCAQGADLDLTNERSDSQIVGRTALHLAILRGHKLIALELIKRKAKIDTKDCDGHSPYLSAYQRGMTDVCEALIQRLKDEDQQQANSDSYFKRLGLDFVDGNGRTLLHDAALAGNDEFVSLLCTLMADPNVQDKNYKTPIFLAASRGHSKSVELLLASGADPTLKTRYSEKTALEKAREKEHHDCVKLIEAWLRDHSQEEEEEVARSTNSSDESDEVKERPEPVQAMTEELNPPPESVQVDHAAQTSAMSLLYQFIQENSALNTELNAQIKTYFMELKPPIPEDINEFLSLLTKEPDTDLSTLKISSGKNILHLITEFDPEGQLLIVLNKLSPSQIFTLINQKTEAGKYPFHCASEQGHSKLTDFCLIQMLRAEEGTSRFRQSLYGDSAFIEWLLGLKHFPKKIPILFEVMADLHAEISTRQTTSQNAALTKDRFFSAQLSGNVYHLRKRLLHRIFHLFDWPDELNEAVAKLIAISQSPNHDPTKEKSKEHQLLDLLISRCPATPPPFPFYGHALIILTLTCQSLEKNPEKDKFPARVQLEAQFHEQIQKHSEEMLKRVKALYDYLGSISSDLASAFLKKIVKSESLLKLALQKALSSEGWWNVEISAQFEETLLLQFTKPAPTANY